ncbi:MAG: histidine kinase [Thermoanaerobaculia bacterium]|nr:histidine kinase [Thermoanaerobaculia bacterium]
MKTPPLLLVCTLAATGACAQYPLRVEPVYRNYSTDQGLPNNWVYDIFQDSKGYIWIATNSGVCRFNGYTFEQLPDTLNCNYTTVLGHCMTEDENGRLWFADFQHRLFYVENDRIIPWKHNERLTPFTRSNGFFQGLLVDGRGENIWLQNLTQGGFLHIDTSGTFTRILHSDKVFFDIFENERGWLLNRNPVSTLRDVETGQLESLAFNRRKVRLPAISFPLGYDQDPKLWWYSINRLAEGRYILQFFKQIYYFEKNRLIWTAPLTGNGIIWATCDAAGRIFTGHHFGGGLKMFHSLDDLRAGRPALELFPGLTVSCIRQDREGGYWIGTQERGIFYCSSFDNGVLRGIPGLEQEVVKGLAWDGKYTLYIGYYNGNLYAADLKRNRARDISAPQTIQINRLHFDEASQTLALAGVNSNLYRAGHWIIPELTDPVSGKTFPWRGGKSIPGPVPDRWLSASSQGLFQVNSSTRSIERSSYDLLLAKNLRNISTVCPDPAGRIWASDLKGLLEWVGDSLVRTGTAFPALQQRIRDIVVLPDSSLVLSPKGHGVVFWKPGRAPVEYNTRVGVLSGEVGMLYYHAPDSAIWACTNRGLNRLTPDGRGGYRVSSLTTKHGLPSNTVNAICVAGDTIWLATDQGVFRMSGQAEASAIPAPLITEILAGNAPRFTDGYLSLPYDSSDVVLGFISLHFRSQGHIPYAYRLLYPSGDTSWTIGFERRVSFANLSPGTYRFEVKAQNENGAWSAVSILTLVIRPPWWATWWARGAFAGLLALLAYAGYRYRIRQVRTEGRLREEMLRLEIAALQARMNPHFIFNCLNSIQSFILNNEPEAAVLYLAKFAKLIRGALNASANGAVSVEEEVQLLDHYLALERLRFNHVFDYRVTVDPKIDPENTFLPPLIVQPFVENAVLHGMKGVEKDGRVEVAFGQENGYLRIDVHDNGAGMASPDARESGNISHGRSITRRRLELIQQQNDRQAISVEYEVPEQGQGTHVSIRLPQ